MKNRETNIRNTTIRGLLYLFIVISIASCSNIKNVPDNKSLLIQNKIKIKHTDAKKDRRPLQDEVYVIPVQKPNKSIFNFFRLKLWLYNVVNEKTANKKYKEKLKRIAYANHQTYDSLAMRKFNYWVKYTLGEPPVYFDSLAIPETKKLLVNYFNNKGYYYKTITTSYKTVNKRTTVSYDIKVEEPFKVYDLYYPNGNSEVEKIIQNNKKNSYFVFGDYFDVANIKLERDRLANDLRNKGYYDITRENFTFDLDTSFDYKKINLRLVINKPDSTEFKKYTLRNIYVYPNFTISNINRLGYNDTIRNKGLDYISDIHKFKPKRLSEFIFLREGDVYSQELYQLSLQRLTNLGVFKFTNIEFVQASNAADNNQLDVFVYLTPSKKQSFSIDLDQNYTTNGSSDKTLAGFLGSGISFSYKNKNLTRNADQFSVTTSAALQYSITKKDSISQNNSFGLIDIGIEFAYSQNRFLIPFKLKKLSLRSNPKSRVSLSYNYQKRFNYFTLNKFNFKYGYDWFSTPRLHNYLNIADLSVLVIPPKSISDDFKASLEDNPIQKLSFSDGIIPASSYTLVYLGQKSTTDYRYMNYLFNVEIAGNVVNGVAWLANRNKPSTGSYTIFNTKYYQYVKFESDLKFYFVNEDKSALIGRLYGGIGIPYGNSSVMPYVKQFSMGGPNSIRAFKPFTLGPGSTLVDKNKNVLQLGNIKIEANAEYRFGLYRWFKGALFVDAGNIWNLRRLPSQPEANFSLSRFYKEIAVGAGAGIRADFQFFVIRFDVGFRLYDPTFVENERWQLPYYKFGNKKTNTKAYLPFNLNLAIGYPF
ncbi:MAG: BamA/TamA family outer membrane protein [Bacteroidota bacterium]